LRQEIIGKKRAGETGNDHDLLQAGQTAAHAGRRHFADVRRRQHAGRADAGTGGKARQNHHQREVAAPAAIALTMKRIAAATITRRRPHRSADPSGHERTECTTRQQRADGDAQPSRAQIKRAAQPLLSAVDDPAVVAEHEAADGGHADDGGHHGQVDRCVAIIVQSDSPPAHMPRADCNYLFFDVQTGIE
jgi:hypothetical protein